MKKHFKKIFLIILLLSIEWTEAYANCNADFMKYIKGHYIWGLSTIASLTVIIVYLWLNNRNQIIILLYNLDSQSKEK